jgi:hypothetical protein
MRISEAFYKNRLFFYTKTVTFRAPVFLLKGKRCGSSTAKFLNSYPELLATTRRPNDDEQKWWDGFSVF